MNRLALTIATWFGCGYWPWGPGTAGSASGVLAAWLWVRYGGLPPWTLLPLALICTLPGVWAAGRTAHMLGREDPGLVVVDEVLGQWITLSALHTWSWQGALAAFVLFRIFDMTKPWPLRKLEDLPSGWGIVADDLGAGCYGWVVLFVAGWFNFR